MKLVVAAVSPTPILWRRASGLASPTEVPASTLPARGMAPVRANIASRSVVFPLWKGPTSAMHRGPRGLLTSCPIAASSSGARPLIGSAAWMLPPRRRFGKPENVAAVHPCAPDDRLRDKVIQTVLTIRLLCFRLQMTGVQTPLASRPKFQAFQPGRYTEADLALHADRLQRDRIVRAAYQRIAPDPDANRRASLSAGVI